jgi:hypothetical protein
MTDDTATPTVDGPPPPGRAGAAAWPSCTPRCGHRDDGPRRARATWAPSARHSTGTTRRRRSSRPSEPPSGRATGRTTTACGSTVAVDPRAAGAGLGGLAGLDLPNSGADVLAFDRVGSVGCRSPTARRRCPVLDARLHGRPVPALPRRDQRRRDLRRRPLHPRHGKGADLGGDPAAGTIVVDLNFSFQPSCAFDPKWACPLAPPENRLAARIEAGERLR